jgi:2,3-bisphosphoglycerate-independent phosphoglycerate mutase
MVIDIEQIREDEFILFRKAIKQFYKGRQDSYLEEFKQRIESGEIDPDDPHYKEFCNKDAKEFMSSRGSKVLEFIKSYVDQRSSEILDAVNIKKSTKGKAKVQLEVLKYILEAGEEDSLK